MPPKNTVFARLRLLLIAILIAVAVGIVSMIASLYAQPNGLRLVPADVHVALPPLPGTPISPYAQLDPGVISYLESGQPSYDPAPIGALGAEAPPLGAYLPRSGSSQFALAAPTEFPTLVPYPTSPPLPTPRPDAAGVTAPTALPFDAQSTAVPPDAYAVAPLYGDNWTPQPMPYAGVVCAPSGLPIDGILTQRFHYYHSGIDLGVPTYTPIFATHSGQITFAGWSEIGYGYLVILQNGPYITYYAHQTSFNVMQGEFVIKGTIIGWSGSTGNSSGPHVHYETRINDVPVDPLTFESRGYPSC